MRWDRLFDDIETQLERGLDAEELDLAAEEERLRCARLTLRDRLLTVRTLDPGSAARLTLTAGERMDLWITDAGRDWIAGIVASEGRATTWAVVPLAAIASVVLPSVDGAATLPDAAHAAAAPGLAARLGLPVVLRDLCRRCVAVRVVSSTADTRGTIDRVGRDHLDLAVHEPETPRRASAVTEVRVIALATVQLVSCVTAPER